MADAFTFHEITSLQDGLYDAWLDLYQTAFPLSEQMLVSEHNKTLRAKESGRSGGEHYLAMLNAQGVLVGMARYDLFASCRAAALWYLAVLPDQRSQGIGSKLYQEIVRRIGEQAAVETLLYEVESPDETHSAEGRELAHRRIAFYRRNQARLMEGIHYVQSVGWQPSMPMRLMAHTFRPMDAQETFQIAKCVFQESLQQTGLLTLD